MALAAALLQQPLAASSAAAAAAGFLPASMQDSVLEELRTTEGMLFHDEGAKKLFLDVKALVTESLGSAHATFSGELYEAVLDRYVAWDAAVATEELARAATHFQDIAARLTPVTVLYAKYLYAGRAPGSPALRIRKPRLDALLRGMFTRLARLRHVRSGVFFELNPLQQDFVVRDAFRQTLATDCIAIVEAAAASPSVPVTRHPQGSAADPAALPAAAAAPDDDDADTAIVFPAAAAAQAPTLAAVREPEQTAHAVPEEAARVPQQDAAERVLPEAAHEPPEAEPTTAAAAAAHSMHEAAVQPAAAARTPVVLHTRPDMEATRAFVRAVQDDDVYPSDSISSVLVHHHYVQPHPTPQQGEQEEADAHLPAARQRAPESTVSRASARSRATSQFRMPRDVRRVLIQEAASVAAGTDAQ